MPGGRPPKFTDVKQFDELVDSFIAECKDNDSPVTITGLALHLGFCDKSSLYDYEKKPEFSHSVKKARAFVESEYEKRLAGNGCAGAIFALKNFGWKDTQDITHNGDVSVGFGFKRD